MKNLIAKISKLAFKLIPVCAGVILTATANSSICWMKGQEEPPANIKRFRKF